MFRPWSVGLALLLCGTFGWPAAHATNKFKVISAVREKVVAAVGESAAATKVFEDLKKTPAALKRLYDAMRKPTLGPGPASASPTHALENLSASDRGTIILDDELGLSKSYLEHAGVDSARYEIKNWKLYLHPPISFELPGRGRFELSEIDLLDPRIPGACALIDECKKFVSDLRDKIAPGANAPANVD